MEMLVINLLVMIINQYPCYSGNRWTNQMNRSLFT